jgi:ribosome-binding factor A
MKIRTERLKEMIRTEAAELLLHGISDPRLGFCTVTTVDLTKDLSYCTIHVSVLGNAGVKSRTMHALQDARGLIQSHIASRMRTRTTPHVTIELDETIERSFAILDKIKQARASDPDGGRSTQPPPEADEDEEEEEE